MMTTCHDLAATIHEMQPEATPTDVARLCLLLTNAVEDLTKLEDQDQLTSAWNEMGLKLQHATDQHAAMTQELEDLAQTDPKQFSADQIWILVRAIKVQSQVLQLYLGDAALDV
jgi:DNA-binding transcriptional regulator GbsR (MarR family)